MSVYNLIIDFTFGLYSFILISQSSSSTEERPATMQSMRHISSVFLITIRYGTAKSATPVILFNMVCNEVYCRNFIVPTMYAVTLIKAIHAIACALQMDKSFAIGGIIFIDTPIKSNISAMLSNMATIRPSVFSLRAIFPSITS